MKPKLQATTDKLESRETKPGVSSFSIILICVCLSLVGVCFLPLLNIQLNPTSNYKRFSVYYYWPDASPVAIEKEVTAQLEGIFSAVKGLQDIYSVSGSGYGRIDLQFKKNVDMDAMRFEVANLIRNIYSSLPEKVSYPILSSGYSNHENTPLISYTLNGSSSPYFIQKYAEKNILPKLNHIKGINAIEVYGASPYQWMIEFNTQTLKSLGLRGNDIVAAINNFFRKGFIGRGNFKPPESSYWNETTVVFQSHTGDSLNWQSIPIKKVNGRIVHLGEVAKARYEEQLPTSYYRVNGLNTVNIIILPEKEINTIACAKQVKGIIDEIKKELPAGYSLILASDTTAFLVKELKKVAFRSIFALAILLLFVLVFSRNLKYLFLIVISMATSLTIAVILYYLLGTELHWYSLAGVTISYGFIVDNSIMMTHHYRSTGHRKVFRAMLGATLCTIGAMSIIFLLKEEQKMNLKDFSVVIAINLFVSLFVSLFFIPALVDRFKLAKQKNEVTWRRKKRIMQMSFLYERFILFGKRKKWVYIVVFILAFGIPVQWLPVKIESEGRVAEIYNNTLGNQSFQEYVKPYLEKIVGGSCRLFTQYVFQNASYVEPTRTTLYVNTKMPHGCTTAQHNDVIKIIENYVSRFEEVDLFETYVNGYASGRVIIYFKSEFEHGAFPHRLKHALEGLVTTIGSVETSIYGVGQGFSNAIYADSRSGKIMLEGYNYEQLYSYATLLKERLAENPRVKEVDIAGTDAWNTKLDFEYYMNFDAKQMALNDLTPQDFYYYLLDETYQASLNPVYHDEEMQPVTVTSDIRNKFNVWRFNNEPVSVNGNKYKISLLGKNDKQRNASDIHKVNQQYHLVVVYSFVGNFQLSELVSKQHIEKMSSFLPVGYKVFQPQEAWWNKDEKGQYYLILLVIIIIYFICAILFESLLQPLAIIAIIPISFVGLFLTFYWFNINFDQGGFASFILLCGVVVNAGLYIVNDYNNFCKAIKHKADLSLYIKAFNYKIIPIILILMASLLSLIPFMYDGQKEVFWFAFAAGTIGGLIFSLIGIIIYLPLFLRFNINKTANARLVS